MLRLIRDNGLPEPLVNHPLRAPTTATARSTSNGPPTG
jgi:hypothetical protein